ncbi:MAG TPA: metalloregulator ArsR/SmtB family transcription factor [Spirochaetota bacterium]|nr:metalloregulator ArsR/SmtB family transcription factor [Spirochaetota bacterium]HPC42538.1 metalloregulator ArsR/SmtB family transcription factor [Spirochaetota bacterium]HPL15492.1 metalloregulator ArsR/SmtB family transcription factor [Spirochaetota bacterium]HQF10174.1 metalloregulator ArsR/SmtB family transcription factor [Spirochaetota bacterium]HQH98958.1 metalloregulator ArsR/SmtB family transcription factor [Spirochaetota bacterium]
MKSAQLFKALGEDARILILLLVNELKVSEITAIMKLRQAHISTMLKILKNCGLVSSRRAGKFVYDAASEKGSGGRFNMLIRTYIAEDGEMRAHYTGKMDIHTMLD